MPAALNILVVEDNDELRDTTVQVLRDEGHHAIGVWCAEEVSEHLDAVDIMLIDLNLPGEDGLALATRIRQVQPSVGLIMVTARRLPEDKRRGYDSGADIYLPKPVDFGELCAAIAALGRRIQPRAEVHSLRLDPKRLVLQGLQEREVSISRHEAVLLIALARSTGHRLETWQLIEMLDKENLHNPKAALELQIVRLRKKLTEAGAHGISLQNIRGWGYQLCTPIQML